MAAHALPHQISPELALVDSELAALARAMPPPRFAQPAPGPTPAQERQRPRHLRRLRGTVVRLGVVSVLFAIVPSIDSLIATEPAPSVLGEEAARTTLPPATVGAKPLAPVHLAWPAVPRASYYNIVVVRGSRRIRDLYTTRTSVAVRPAWTIRGRVHGLTPGAYSWYVFPGFGRRSTARYGGLVAEGTFSATTLTRASPPSNSQG